MKRIRLSTLILLIVIVAMGFGLVAQQRREARLNAALSLYRDRANEAILEMLDQPIAVDYTDKSTLDDVLKQIRVLSRGARLTKGIPIYIDPIGLQEAQQSLIAPIQAPFPRGDLPLREQLRRILKPLSLSFSVASGYLMITSEDSMDEETVELDPYLKYRDVLK
jgi:hypothetical protein